MPELIAFCKWCQDLPAPELAKNLKDLGFDGVDLPCRPGGPVTHETGPEKLPEFKKVFEDHGLKLERLVTSVTEANDETDRLLEAINAVGVKKIRIGGYPVRGDDDPRAVLDTARKNLVELQKLLEKHGVMGGIQNHSGSTLDVNISSCLLMIQDCDPEWVGVQYDPGHLTLSGEPIGLAIGLLGPYLQSVNFKSPRQEHYIDPKSERLTYKPIWVPLRDGMLDLPGVLSALEAAGYTDPIALHAEYRNYYYMVEKDVEATNKLVAEDVRYLRSLMAK